MDDKSKSDLFTAHFDIQRHFAMTVALAKKLAMSLICVCFVSQLCGAAGVVHEDCRAPVVCLTHSHGVHQTGQTVPLCYCQTR